MEDGEDCHVQDILETLEGLEETLAAHALYVHTQILVKQRMEHLKRELMAFNQEPASMTSFHFTLKDQRKKEEDCASNEIQKACLLTPCREEILA